MSCQVCLGRGRLTIDGKPSEPGQWSGLVPCHECDPKWGRDAYKLDAAWHRFGQILGCLDRLFAIQLYGDARQAAERADVRKFLVGEVSKRINLMHAATSEADLDKYEAESIAIDNVYADIVEGEHVGAAEREARR